MWTEAGTADPSFRRVGYLDVCSWYLKASQSEGERGTMGAQRPAAVGEARPGEVWTTRAVVWDASKPRIRNLYARQFSDFLVVSNRGASAGRFG